MSIGYRTGGTEFSQNGCSNNGLGLVIELRFHEIRIDLLEWFKFFLPMRYLMNVLLRKTNERIDGPPVTEGEFLNYIGIELLLATVKSGTSGTSYWETDEPNPFYGAPFRYHHYMSRRRFENITKTLTYTDRPHPSYVDILFEVRQLLNSFNLHMRSIFLFRMGVLVCSRVQVLCFVLASPI